MTQLFDVAAAGARRFGDAPFLVVGARSESISFREFGARADDFGRVLAGVGVRPGDRVALWMTNCIDWAVAAYGAARCGGVLVALNTRLSPREITHMIALTEPTLLIAEEVFLGKINVVELLAAVRTELNAQTAAVPRVMLRSMNGARTDTLDWHTVTADGQRADLPSTGELAASAARAEPDLAGVAAILSTSGTTAAPKGVMLGHVSLVQLATACAARQELRPGERFYSVAPFFHCSGYMHALLANLVAGSTLYTSPAFNPHEAWSILTGEAITAYHGSIVPLQDIERLPQFARALIPNFDRAWYSAPAIEMARIEAVYGTRMCEVYGLTETGGNVAICRTTDPVDMRHDSDGRPHDGVEVTIADPSSGAPLPDGMPGEIRVRGFNVMRGYFRDPEATARAIDSQGWLRTGDRGVRLPGGFIKFLSRMTDVIRVGGENLSPLEVEDVLLAYRGVVEAAVVGTPHPRLTEVPVAFVRVDPANAPNAADLTTHCRAQLANFKIPARFIFVQDFPRSSAVPGRISKSKLREMLVADAQPEATV